MTNAAPIKTTCPYCGVGCGVVATPNEDASVSIAGDKEHPASFGRLCSKGSALGETLSLDDRLLHPHIHGEQVGWDAALSHVADAFRTSIDAHGPDSVAIYGSGQLLTEDYYVANKLMKGFIGSGNMDTNSRLCMASSVAGHKRAFGSDTVPGSYEDLDEADLVVLVGSNFAWCHPVLFQRLQTAQAKRGTKVVVIDPSKTATAQAADMHLAIRPGADVALFNGLLAHLSKAGLTDTAFVADHTSGHADALGVAGEPDLYQLADITGIETITLQRFYELFAATSKTVTIYSQGVNQSSAGTDKVNAIINCHLLTGRIGKPGSGPFSITGQPNAMGGREVGGLANQLAAHMSVEDADDRDRVGRFWGTSSVTSTAGLKAVDLFKAIERGDIKILWVMATNPAASMPEADLVAAALKKCPTVIVSDVTATTRTAKLADVLLPAAGWGEKDGTVTNSERRISRQRKFLPLPGEARPDWWIMSQVAQRLGFDGFGYTAPSGIFAEHAALSAFENEGSRDFDIGAYANLSPHAYDALTPFQWPAPNSRPAGTKRLFASGGFFTPNRRANFVPTPHRPPASTTCDRFPLVLNTGRVRDQWHTMTRTGKTGRLFAHTSEPYVEIHPDDACAADIEAADLVAVESTRGRIMARALVADRQVRGNIFVPMHWTDPYASCAHPDVLVGPHVDPVSGQPELKHTPVRISRVPATWHGFVMSMDKPDVESFDYWALGRTDAGWRGEIAGLSSEKPLEALATDILGGGAAAGADVLSSFDLKIGIYRTAVFNDGRLHSLLLLSPQPVEAARAWLCDQLGQTFEGQARHYVLAGRAGVDQPDKGAIICSCFQVGLNEIAAAATDGAGSVDAVGSCTKAGTNCGSCRMEIKRIVETINVKQAV
ncbi:nitrate reductase [Pyruvatibacter sp. HU-CL02332]|uniref:nitrate reductase n=1 Tax=Pyruvatibacter sp. HU-CL02332 TaxID=3127650 RepID=UPI0031024AEA